MCAWATCYSGSNNIIFDSPPIMSDGRNFTSWQPTAIINDRIQKSEGISDNFNYRQYLQNNSLKIMDYNTIETCYDLGLDPHIEKYKTPANNVPHKFKNVFDMTRPGFGYSNSDLKNPYLSREQLNARLLSPSINLKQ